MSLENENAPNFDEKEEEDEDMEMFFSKKKSKKGKKKKQKKAETGESLAEPTPLKQTESNPEGEQQASTELYTAETATAEEEWNDYEDQEKDYSDLKIQNLQISETPIANPEEDEREYDESGELVTPKVTEGPWNKTVASGTNESKPAEPVPVVKAEPPKVQAYRPPSMRTGGEESGLRRMARRKQQAPEINNVMDFPTLDAAMKDNEPQTGFQVVKTGTGARPAQASSTAPGGVQPWRSRRQQEMQQASTLKLGNQFSALNDRY